MFRHLNQKLLRWLHKRSGAPDEIVRVAVDERGATLVTRAEAGAESARVVSWDEIEEVAAVRTELVAHAVVGMIIRSRTAGVVRLDEQVPGFSQLAAALSNHLRGALRFEDWYPQLMSSSTEPGPVTVYRRNGVPER